MLSRSLTNFLYQNIAKPVFFKLEPETVHETMTAGGEVLGRYAATRFLTDQFFAFHDPRLSRTFNGISFPNPVGLAAGFDYQAQLPQITASVGFGWQSIGTVTWLAYKGNPKPRLVRLKESGSLIVNKGLKGPGARIIAHKLQRQDFPIPIGISIASTNKKWASGHEQLLDIAQSFQIFEQKDVRHSYYEMNISCPNTFGGEPFTTPDRLKLLLKMLDLMDLSRPLYLKMPSDLSSPRQVTLLKVANHHNVQGVIMANLWKKRESGVVSQKDTTVWMEHQGNLSGKPTWKRSNELVALVRNKFKNRFTIIGTGGIFSPADAQTKLDLGADLVQLVTGMIFQGPQLIGQINRHLAEK